MHIKVGLLFSLTGTTAITEKGQCDAARLAIEESSHEPYKVEAIVRDICSDPRKGAREAEKLAKEGVRIFIGCYTSVCRKAILPVLEKYNCLLVYPTLYEGHECHPNVIYTGEVPNQQVHTLLDYLTRHYGKRVYCIGTDYLYPRQTAQQVHTFLRERNGAVIKEHYVPFGHQQFQDVWNDILTEEPDAIFSTLVGKSIIPFYRDHHRIGKRRKVPIFSPITKETELEAIGAEYGAGHYSSASYFQSLPSPENVAFISRFQRFTGGKRAISSVMFNTYVGTKMVLDSIAEAKSTNHQEIFQQLGNKSFETACGTLLVDARHRHLSRPVKIGKSLSNGQFEIVWDSERNILPKPFLVTNKPSPALHEIVLQAWGQISEEAVLVVSEHGTVIYMSSKAAELTRFANGQSLTPAMLQAMHQSFQVTSYTKQRCQFYLLKPKQVSTADTSQPIFRFGRIQTVHSDYQRELEIARLAAQSSANVLILGETGTGKEVMAESIHRESKQKNGPFIAVNTALLPKDLIASELFGFVDGAFTGAKRGGAIGKFEAAHNGTIFLDEIGDMPLELQVVLLRVIESKKIVRLGDTKERAVNVRIIAATNRNLPEEIASRQTFRSDLFYRLNVLSITIPPLKERSADIAYLCHEFVHEFFLTYGDGPQSFQKEALQSIVHYPWPGNIRELRNVVERAFLLARKDCSEIKLDHLPLSFKNYDHPQQGTEAHSLKSLERQVIEQALQQTKSVTEASQFLGIARSTLYRKIKSYS